MLHSISQPLEKNSTKILKLVSSHTNEELRCRIGVDIQPVENPCPLCKEGGISCTGTGTEIDIMYLISNDNEPKEVFTHIGRDYVVKIKTLSEGGWTMSRRLRGCT